MTDTFLYDPADLPERFRAKMLQAPNGCWHWIAAKSRDGYGRYALNYKTLSAHRVSYELLAGPIPEGLQLDHLCRVRHCVNPAHLEPVTCRENLIRGATEAARNTAKTHCKNGHGLAGDNLVTHPDGHRQCRRCQLDAVARWARANRATINAARRRRRAAQERVES